MANDVIFKVNNIDFSGNVVAENYNVNFEDIFQEWTDGGYVKHKDIIRRRLVGSFEMFFPDATSLEVFYLALSTSKTTASTYPVNLKANNEGVGVLRSAYVFIDMKPVRRRRNNDDAFDIFEVTIEEP